jgi:hypothetical protein
MKYPPTIPPKFSGKKGHYHPNYTCIPAQNLTPTHPTTHGPRAARSYGTAREVALIVAATGRISRESKLENEERIRLPYLGERRSIAFRSHGGAL